MSDDQTIGQEIIEWIEANCRVPEGALVGRPLELMPWQRREILRIYDNPAVTRRAIISVAQERQDQFSCMLGAGALGWSGRNPKQSALFRRAVA